MDCLSVFLKHKVTKNEHTSIFTCAHHLLCGDQLTTIYHGNYSDMTLICQMSQLPWGSMTLCTCLKTPSPENFQN